MTAARAVAVVDPGPFTTVQDRGRPGWKHLGVPRSGVLDVPAGSLANRLVGNPADAALLETTAGGVSVRVTAAMACAVTGAVATVAVDGRGAAWGEPLSLRAGQTLTVGPAVTGLRCYVAFAGGVAAQPVLGSRSTDTLSGLGPPPLVAGDVIPVAEASGAPRGSDVAPVVRPPSSPVRLRFVPGPREDWFDEAWHATLTGSTYRVSADSNRIGLRLTGPGLGRTREQELPSEGVVLGAIQVPPSGQPLVFLNDHPTTGGYPVVGVVLPEDLRVCAQLRPGDQVGFARG